jgi:hypothetical protein
MRKDWYHFMVILVLLGFSCETQDEPTLNLRCVKGKYLGQYCEGIVIQILDDTKFGKDWKGFFTSQPYSNAVVVSLDSLLIKSGYNPRSLSSTDSIFYFRLKDGGYPRKQYNVCEPSPFMTVFLVSNEACDRAETE